MKKYSYGLNVIFICIITFIACSRHLTTSVSVDCATDAFTGVTVTNFMKDVARYRDTHLELINNDIISRGIKPKGFSDARSCWYSLDSLKKFICLMEKYSTPLHLTSKDLGIRFYYAVYPQGNIWKKEYKNLHTLMLVPTYNKKGDHISFDPKYAHLKNLNKIIDLKDMGSSPETLFALDIGDAYERGIPYYSIRNQGGLCPPTCPPSPHEFDYIDRHFRDIGYTTE